MDDEVPLLAAALTALASATPCVTSSSAPRATSTTARSTPRPALTGIDTDRLKEEKERGITIDLGFAHLDLGGRPDPRHRRRARARAVREEHAGRRRRHRPRAAGRRGGRGRDAADARAPRDLPAARASKRASSSLTKADLAEPRLARAGAGGRPAPCSRRRSSRAPDPAGLGEDRRGPAGAARGARRARPRPCPRAGPTHTFRLPIDRVFTIRGFGTVVTGTLAAGALALDERVEVYPRGLQAKVRGIQTARPARRAARRRPARGGEPPGRRARGDRARRRALAAGPPPAHAPARRDARAPRGRAAARSRRASACASTSAPAK